MIVNTLTKKIDEKTKEITYDSYGGKTAEKLK